MTTETFLSVQGFIGLSAKERTQLLASAPLVIEYRPKGPSTPEKQARRVGVSAVERDDSATSMHAGIRYQGFGKLLPTASSSVVLNDPATKDKSFKFEWV